MAECPRCHSKDYDIIETTRQVLKYTDAELIQHIYGKIRTRPTKTMT